MRAVRTDAEIRLSAQSCSAGADVGGGLGIPGCCAPTPRLTRPLYGAQDVDPARFSRRQRAGGFRHFLRGGDPGLRDHPTVSRASSHRAAADTELRFDLRDFHQRPVSRHRQALDHCRAAARLVGWVGASTVTARSCGFHGELFNWPGEVAEVRYALYVEQLRLNGELGGEGGYRAGKGIVVDLVRADGWALPASTHAKHAPAPGVCTAATRGRTQPRRGDPHGRGRRVVRRGHVAGERGRIDPHPHRNGGGYDEPKQRRRDLVLACSGGRLHNAGDGEGDLRPPRSEWRLR